MATAQIKKVIRIGGSMAIILPIEWAKDKVQPGQELVVIANDELRIFPVHSRGSASKESETSALIDL
jgi:antitoxin component of MazEF toxin-antitoxin module